MEQIIHRIVVTEEAAGDYADLGGFILDRSDLARELAEYITIRQFYERGVGYFRANCFDGGTDRMLMLFIYKAGRMGLMQFWEIRGICEAADWTEDAEYDGQVRAWINTRTMELPDDYDWAVGVRVREILQITNKTLYENVLQEVTNAFEHERDKKDAEELAFLQSVYFDIRGRRGFGKKIERDRTGGRCVRRRKPKGN